MIHGSSGGFSRQIGGLEFRNTWRLAWPVILANLSVPLLGAVDTAVMGHLPDAAFIGAVALGAMIFSFLYWGFGFLRMGTTGFTAQARGADDPDEIRDTLIRACVLGLGLAALVFALQKPAAWAAFTAIDAEPFVEAQARTYFDVRIWGAPATLINYSILGWLLGMQRPRSALAIQVGVNGLNIVGDIVLVFGFGMETAGVALATVLSEYVGVALGLAIVAGVWRQCLGDKSTAWDWHRIADRQALWAMIRVNADIFVRTLCLIFAFATFTAKSAALGTTVLAVNAVLLIFQQFLAYGLDGFAHAAEALVGAAKGAGDRAGFRRAVASTTILAVAVAGIYTLVFLVLSNEIIGLMTNIEEVRQVAADTVFWLYLSPLISVWSYQLDGIFIGTTRSRDMRNAMAISLAIFLALIVWLPDILGAHGLWLALLIFMATRAITLGIHLPSIDRAISSKTSR